MSSSRRLEPAPPPRGVLRANRSRRGREHVRTLPSAALAPYVAHFWSVRWSLAEPELVETLPHPTVHLVFEQSESRGELVEVAGVPLARFSRELVGEGWVFGVKFRPAMFRLLLRSSVSSLTGRVLPATALLGAEAAAVGRAVFRAPDFEARCACAEAFLRPKLLEIDSRSQNAATLIRDVVERMANDPTLLRVEAAANLLGVDQRTLQRRFREYVGATPKWVLLRYRLHEAAERLKARKGPSLASLAAELGYSDQAHFARDFGKWIGATPSAFVARERNVR